MSFVQAIYKVSENSMAQVTLNLSKSVSKEFSVEVFSTSITALGKIHIIFAIYIYVYIIIIYSSVATFISYVYVNA